MATGDACLLTYESLQPHEQKFIGGNADDVAYTTVSEIKLDMTRFKSQPTILLQDYLGSPGVTP